MKYIDGKQMQVGDKIVTKDAGGLHGVVLEIIEPPITYNPQKDHSDETTFGVRVMTLELGRVFFDDVAGLVLIKRDPDPSSQAI
jgi:hypothetical protein